MWNMYGDGGRGAILVFDYKKLKDAGLSKLSHCDYFSKEEVKEFIKTENQSMKALDGAMLKGALSSFREKAFMIKDCHWEYEDEWRILTKSKNEKLATNKYGVVSYTEVLIPVNCLRNIIFGPLADYEMMKNVLDKKIHSLKEKDKSIEEIPPKHSNLQMR